MVRINRKGLLTVYQGLPASVYAVFFSRMVNSIGNLVFPFLALFLTTKLGYGTAKAGLLMTIGALVYMPGSALGGWLADRVSRKTLLMAGMGLSALLLIPCAFLGQSAAIPLLLIASRFFGAIADPAYNALVGDLTTPDNRKATFSLLYLGHNVGYAIGPMIAGFLFERHLPLLFLGDALTTFLSVAMVARFVPGLNPRVTSADQAPETAPESERTQAGSVWTILWQRPMLLIFALLFLSFNLVYAQHTFALPQQMKDLFGEARGAILYGTLMTVNALTVVALTSFITAATLRVRPLVSVALGGMFFAVGFGMLCFVHALPLFILSTVIWTTGEVLESVNAGVFIANNSPASHRGRISATTSLIAGIGWMAGPWLGGLWLQRFPIQTLWAASFFLATAAALLMLLLSNWRNAENAAVKESTANATESAATT